MKIHLHERFDSADRHDWPRSDVSNQQRRSRSSASSVWFRLVSGLLLVGWTASAMADGASPQSTPLPQSTAVQPKTEGPADRLIAQTIQRIAHGPAFDAKVRQRVWVSGREILGVGTYEQAGQGTGQFNLQVTMLDGDGKHTLQQVSDGRLAWTREQIGEQISLRRVDVGRLDQWVNDSLASLFARGNPSADTAPLKPSVRVGGWTEMMDTISAEHDLTLQSGQLEGRDVWIVKGTLRDDVRAQRMKEWGRQDWPQLCPTQVVVLIARKDDPEASFGKGLPLRIEYWGDPVHTPKSDDAEQEPESAVANAHDSLTTENSRLVDEAPSRQRPSSQRMLNCPLISLIELYSLRPISPPPIGRFRFENQDLDVDFTNETDRYLSRYGIAITERQSRMLRR
ncbi:hypothetical protein LOC70_08365 [Rhodopirellula sp. JC737]|nr:hypothetical protein [Rhodopirellula sp. JC737]